MTEYQNTRRQPARKTEKPMTRRERRRLLRLTVSGVLLVLVVAVKLLMPDVMGQYREKILHLMGENTDFVAAFSAVGTDDSDAAGIPGKGRYVVCVYYAQQDIVRGSL